jgi:hypothetical protein
MDPGALAASPVSKHWKTTVAFRSLVFYIVTVGEAEQYRLSRPNRSRFANPRLATDVFWLFVLFLENAGSRPRYEITVALRFLDPRPGGNTGDQSRLFGALSK